MKKNALLLLAMVAVFAIVVSSQAQAANTEFTFVGGSSSRADSNVNLALASGSYVYTPLNLLIGSSYNCSYRIIVNNTAIHNGTIDVTERAFLDFSIDFPQAGQQDFRVVVGEDIYTFRIHVLKRSFEAEIVDEYHLVNETVYGEYFQKDLIKVFSASLVGTAVAIFLAYWWKVDKIKQEPRRIL